MSAPRATHRRSIPVVVVLALGLTSCGETFTSTSTSTSPAVPSEAPSAVEGATPIAALPGTSWRVGAVNNGRGAMETSSLTVKLTATFGGDATFTGFGGCNAFTGPYRTAGFGGLTIGPLLSTQRSCTDQIDALEYEYVASLARVATWEERGGVLRLRDAGGATQLTASAVHG